HAIVRAPHVGGGQATPDPDTFSKRDSNAKRYSDCNRDAGLANADCDCNGNGYSNGKRNGGAHLYFHSNHNPERYAEANSNCQAACNTEGQANTASSAVVGKSDVR